MVLSKRVGPPHINIINGASKRKKLVFLFPIILAIGANIYYLFDLDQQIVSLDISDVPSHSIPLFDEYALQVYMHNQRKALINESSAMKLGCCRASKQYPTEGQFFHDLFGDEMEEIRPWKEILQANSTFRDAYLSEFRNPYRGDLLVGSVCDAISIFRATNGTRKHVLISGINDNWGAFSDPVPNRTVNWGEWEGHFKRAGCAKDDLWYYLDHANVSAIFTTTHQWLDHPKIFSVPLGVKDVKRIAREIHEMPTPNRTAFLMINQSPWQHRPAVAAKAIFNFNGEINNTYHDGSDYWEELRKSKFVLAPSGMGWDSYRVWEALMMGTIPIVETYYRQDGFYRSFDDLPVLLVDHFNNVTPSLLEEAYPKILSRAKEYNFAKLTNLWWRDLINSFRSTENESKPNLDKGGANSILQHVNGQEKTHISFPPSISVCNTTALSFDKSKFTLSGQSLAHIPSNGTSFAYAPWLTKAGSTSLIKALKFASTDAPSLDIKIMSKAAVDRYNFVSVLRHPIDRALAGFHQVEVFWLMNWIDGTIDKMKLNWWNRTCLNSTYAADKKQNGRYPCTGSEPKTTTERRLQRLNDFLDEIEVKGFWDQHIAPMSYLIDTNPAKHRTTYFDIQYLNDLADLIVESSSKQKTMFSNMERGNSDRGMDWVIKWKELVSLSSEQELARSAIEKMCHLYRADIECLPYEVPECAPSKDIVLSPEKLATKEAALNPSTMCGIMFLHIRKTGGTFIGNSLRSWLRNDHTRHCCGISNSHKIPCPSAPAFYRSDKYDNWTCSDFHFVENEWNPFNPEVLDIPCVFTITAIRNPIERVISHFLYEFADVKAFKANNPQITSDKAMYSMLLGNSSLWNTYLDDGSDCPLNFWNNMHIANYLSYALDPWYGAVPHAENAVSTIIYQKSNDMWKDMEKKESFHQKRCNRTHNIDVGVQLALDHLSKFSLVLSDTNKEVWTREMARSLGANIKGLGIAEGRSNSPESKTATGCTEGFHLKFWTESKS